MLADQQDPIYARIPLPKLSRRERQIYVTQHLAQHHPEADWRGFWVCPGLPNGKEHHALCAALNDAPHPEHPLAPCLDALIARGHHMAALLTPGQLLAEFARQASPTLVCLKDEDGLLVSLIVAGVCRFSRRFPVPMMESITPEALPNYLVSHLMPTLQAHQLIDRQQTLAVQNPVAIKLNDLLDTACRTGKHRGIMLSNPRLALHQKALRWNRWQHHFALAIWPFALLLNLCLLGLAWQQNLEAVAAQEAIAVLVAQPPAAPPVAWRWLKTERENAPLCPVIDDSLTDIAEVLAEHPEIALHHLNWQCTNNHRLLTLTLKPAKDTPESDFLQALPRLMADSQTSLGPTQLEAGSPRLNIQLNSPTPR